MTEMAKHSH